MPPASEQVTSADGTVLTYETHGSGPGIVVMPGTLRAAKHYRVLAGLLADTHTVHLLNRRGRFGSGPQGADYGVAKECEDLAAVLAATGATTVFGHSYGGFIAMEYARDHPVGRLVVYEPAISVDGSIPTGWVPELEQAIAEDKPARGLALLFKNLDIAGPFGKIPTPVLTGMLRMMTHAEEGRDLVEVLPTAPAEIRVAGGPDTGVARYRDLDGVVVLCGDHGAAWMRAACAQLAEHPGTTLITVEGAGHNAPDQDAPQLIAPELRALTV